MKFLIRCIVVLAVAIAVGLGLYYSVQALPNSLQNFIPGGEGFRPERNNGPLNNPFVRPGGIRPEGFEGGEGGAGLFGFVRVIGRVILFAGITFVTVIIARFLKRKPEGGRTQAT